MSDHEPLSALLLVREAQIVDVSFPDRTIDLVVIPYDTEAVVPFPPPQPGVQWKGRMVRELITRGAFAGVEQRPNRVKVNRDHDVTRTVGRAVALHPSRPEGLVAEVRIARTPLGDETLELAADGILDASAAMRPMGAGAMEWLRDRSGYRIVKAWLAHIARVPDPAYESATVLGVRAGQALTSAATPNLDVVRGWQAAERFGSLRGE
jgi:HK97 family phage prohead protease